MGIMVEYYDTFVIHDAEGKDLEFVKEMATILEGAPYNLKLFLPWRDLHSTEENETVALAEILTKKCSSALVIVSNNLLRSDNTSFLLSLVHSKNPSCRNKRIIPVKIEKCELPTILQSVTVCDFTKMDMRCWFWPRVANSIQQVLPSKPKDKRDKQLPDLLKELM